MRKFGERHSGLVRSTFWILVTFVVVFVHNKQSDSFIFPTLTEMGLVPTAISAEDTVLESIENFELNIESLSCPLIDPEPSIEPVIEARYGFSNDDIYLLTVLLSGSKNVDGDGEYDIDYGNDDRYDQISLVLSVVMNRVRDSRFPDTVAGVVWEAGQFSPMPRWKDGLPEVSDISLQRVKEWCEAYDAHLPGVQGVPENHVFFRGDGVENHSRAG